MKGFYGVNSQEDYDRFVGILDDIPKIFSRGYFLGDMLITLLRNMSLSARSDLPARVRSKRR